MGIRSAAMVAIACTLGACGGKEARVDHDQEDPSIGHSPAPFDDPASAEPGSNVPPSSPSPTTPDPSIVPPPPCSASFATQVMQIFVDRSCSNSSCHGGQLPRNEPSIDPTNLYATWNGFRAFTLSIGRPYVTRVPGDPTASGMSCNLRGECGVSMLPLIGGTPLTPADAATIDAWLACGAPFN
jgi:hypothetical protein